MSELVQKADVKAIVAKQMQKIPGVILAPRVEWTVARDIIIDILREVEALPCVGDSDG